MNLPAGLIDNRVEFFNDPSNHDISYCIVEGQVSRVSEAPEYIKQVILADLAANPAKQFALQSMGYQTTSEQLEKYCSCAYGAFDCQPDVMDGRLTGDEYWPCPKRATCPAQGILCHPLILAHGTLTSREIQVLTLVGRGKLGKEIADCLAISCETVKMHLKSIRHKSGLENKPELVSLAYQKNLI